MNIIGKHVHSLVIDRITCQIRSFLLLLQLSMTSLKCNRLVSSREHIYQHQSSLSSNQFLIDNVVHPSYSARCSSPPRVHYCYLCRTNFDTAIKMHVHLIEHQYPNHDYQCCLCEQLSFDDANQLYHHMVQHGSKARLYPCRECDVFFMFSMHLINHQYSHKDETVRRSSLTLKANGSNVTTKSTVIVNDDGQRTDDNHHDDVICKSIVTRSSSKSAVRSVTVN
jgi:hypothetical protein